jgi:hypothetical protein
VPDPLLDFAEWALSDMRQQFPASAQDIETTAQEHAGDADGPPQGSVRPEGGHGADRGAA